MTKPTRKASSHRPLGSGPSSRRPLGQRGDFNRFANLAGVRSFTGFVPKIDQSGLVAGHKGITKAGDAGLRQALYMAADHARHIDPTLAQRYYRLVMVEGKHHNSALCSVSAVLITRIAACWRKGELYELRDEDGEEITEAEGKQPAPTASRLTPKSGRPVVETHRPKSSRTGRRVEAERSRPERSLRPPTRHGKKLAKTLLEGLDCR